MLCTAVEVLLLRLLDNWREVMVMKKMAVVTVAAVAVAGSQVAADPTKE